MVYFSPSILVSLQKNLKQCSKGFKTTNKLQLSSAQVDKSFIRHSQDMGAGQLQGSCPPFHTSWLPAPAFLYFPFPLFGCPCAKQGLYPPPVNERECKWAYVQSKLYNTRLCCVCLPIIQSVISRCIYV